MASAVKPEHRDAIERLRAGDWQAAHVIVQPLEDALACRIHALCHRIEGDMANARYWCRRAHVSFDRALGVDDELARLAAEVRALSERPSAPK